MNVIITGSRKGIGLAMAEEFLKGNDRVIISSRSGELINKLVDELSDVYGKDKIFGFQCDVTNAKECEALAEFGKEKFSKLDVWINNAGTNAYELNNLVDFSIEGIKTIVDTNLLGTLYGCRAALKVMIPQKHGHIFNMEGMGSNGMTSPKIAPYGASKAGIPQLTKTLVKELKADKIKVGIHRLSPGIVLTDLTLKEITPESAKVFNILAETTDTVVKYLVPRIRKIKGTGKVIAILTGRKASGRFMTAWRFKNRFFDKEGNLIKDI